MGAMATPEWYQEFKKQQTEAMEKAAENIKDINRQFFTKFNRLYGNGLIEVVGLEGRDTVIITTGSLAGTIKAIQNDLDVGLIRIRSLRPWPAKEIAQKCKDLKNVIVLEKAISFGAAGPLYQDVRAALYGLETKIAGFVAGLGGRDIKVEDIKEAVQKVRAGFEGFGWI
jgi:pyruvate/2-oxoacid:ferredoxin oxidoreductase alpha subunit